MRWTLSETSRVCDGRARGLYRAAASPNMTGSVSPDCDSQNDFHISDSETETASIFSVQTDCSTSEDENQSQADQEPSLFVPSPAFERLRNLLQQRDKQFDLDQLNEQSPADTPVGNSADKDGQVTMCVLCPLWRHMLLYLDNSCITNNLSDACCDISLQSLKHSL